MFCMFYSLEAPQHRIASCANLTRPPLIAHLPSQVRTLTNLAALTFAVDNRLGKYSQRLL